jgi:hypothetical protein
MYRVPLRGGGDDTDDDGRDFWELDWIACKRGGTRLTGKFRTAKWRLGFAPSTVPSA